MARRLAPLERTAQEIEIGTLDRDIAAPGRRVWKPGIGPLRWALAWIRLEEPRDTATIVRLLAADA